MNCRVRLKDIRRPPAPDGIAEFGRPDPLLRPANELATFAARPIDRYARRMPSESAFAAGTGFFRNGAICSVPTCRSP